MCSLAFFAALRVGEVTVRPGQTICNVIHFHQISFIKDHHYTLMAIKLSLVNYKHSDPSRPADILFIAINLSAPSFSYSNF